MYYAASGYEVQGVYVHFPFYFVVCKPPPTFYLPNMKIFALALITFSAVNAAAESSLHLRVHTKGGACTITKESQCDGQNWTGSTCCADSGYECRWSDDGQNVKRCQKKWGTRQHHKTAEVESGSKDTEDDWGSSDSEATDDYGVDSKGSEIDSGSDDSEDWYGSKGSEDEEEGNWSESSESTDDYSESSEVYSGSDDYNEGSEYFGSEGSEFEGWFGSVSGDESYYTYDEGSESDVSAKQHHHHHHHHKRLAKGGCTITNESQCDGQNWTGSTCCADSSYECRWSDDGQNVKRCQKKRGLKL